MATRVTIHKCDYDSWQQVMLSMDLHRDISCDFNQYVKLTKPPQLPPFHHSIGVREAYTFLGLTENGYAAQNCINMLLHMNRLNLGIKNIHIYGSDDYLLLILRATFYEGGVFFCDCLSSSDGLLGLGPTQNYNLFDSAFTCATSVIGAVTDLSSEPDDISKSLVEYNTIKAPSNLSELWETSEEEETPTEAEDEAIQTLAIVPEKKKRRSRGKRGGKRK